MGNLEVNGNKEYAYLITNHHVFTSKEDAMKATLRLHDEYHKKHRGDIDLKEIMVAEYFESSPEAEVSISQTHT